MRWHNIWRLFGSRCVAVLPSLVILTLLVKLQNKIKSDMKTVEAKVEENFREDPESEPDRARNTWLIEGKLNEHIENWENVRLDFRFPEDPDGNSRNQYV